MHLSMFAHSSTFCTGTVNKGFQTLCLSMFVFRTSICTGTVAKGFQALDLHGFEANRASYILSIYSQTRYPMKHILLGTAGHVDHGKTALIRALTGIETDRLAEEKSRGITIDLGFAHMTLPSGEAVSIVDVPGHEKFIKNMLAGAGGIDLVLLVIAADDGVMPQTREHLGILQLLRAKDGIIVLTKCDLADEEWQSLVCEDISALVEDTFLQDAPIVCVSSHTGQGIDRLKEVIGEKIEKTAAKNTAAPFRIPVDRVFSAEGFGTVVTGTLIEGTLKQGDGVIVYPGAATGRVRNLQVHSTQVEAAYAGQRVAVNLSGLRREDILRGHVLAPEGSLQPTRMLDAKLSLLKDSPREVKSGSRLHFHYGTHSTLCKAVLIGDDKLLPGQTGYVQLRFSEEVAVKSGDSFVLRFYSPTETVGGGVVLDTAPKKHRKGRAAAAIKALEALENGDIATQIYQAIDSHGSIVHPDELQKRFVLSDKDWAQEISRLVLARQIDRIGPYHVISDNNHKTLFLRIVSLLKEYHKENPLHQGMRKEELRSRILPDYRPIFFDELLRTYRQLLQVKDGCVALSGFKISYSKEQQQTRDLILACLKQSGYAPPPVEELLAVNKKTATQSHSHKKEAEKIFEALLSEGIIISTEPGIVFESTMIDQAKAAIRRLADTGDGAITLAQFRDEIQTSRKFALSLLEYFDRCGFTRKLGDSRVLVSNTA